jgi:hypothetical protein
LKYLAIIFILILALGLLIIQVAFFAWAFRRIKKHSEPMSPEAYRLICFLIAGLLLLISFGSFSYTTFLLATGVKTTGVVTGLRVKRDEHGEELFTPSFKFIDQSGTTNTVDSNLYSSPDRYRVNERVPIIYRPANPSGARINNFAENWFLPIFTAMCATVVLISIPIRNRWRAYRSRKTRPSLQTQL